MTYTYAKWLSQMRKSVRTNMTKQTPLESQTVKFDWRCWSNIFGFAFCWSPSSTDLYINSYRQTEILNQVWTADERRPWPKLRRNCHWLLRKCATPERYTVIPRANCLCTSHVTAAKHDISASNMFTCHQNYCIFFYRFCTRHTRWKWQLS